MSPATAPPRHNPRQLANPTGEPASAGGEDLRPIALNARLHIGKDGTITVLSGKVEGGQGARTEIAQAAAEELGVPLDQVQVILADTDITPDDGGTFGSQTTPRTIPAIREACAAARKLFDDFASHFPAAKKPTYADLASDEKFIESAKEHCAARCHDDRARRMEDSRHAREPAQCARSGHRRHKYPSDQICPAMLYGKILRPASFGAKLKDVDLAEAQAMEDVVVVRDGDFVGVAAPTTFLAKRAIAAIEQTAQWDSPAHPSSKTLSDYLRKHAKKQPANPFIDEAQLGREEIDRDL